MLALYSLFRSAARQPSARYFSKFAAIQSRLAFRYQQLSDHDVSSSTPCNFTHEVVSHWAKTNQQAIRCVAEDGSVSSMLSYQTLLHNSGQLAHFFRNHGLAEGAPVALMLGQEPAWWQCFAGLIRSGIATVPFPRLLTPQDMTYRFNDLGIQAIVSTPALQASVDLAAQDCPQLRLFVTTGQADGRWRSLNEALSLEPMGPDPVVTTNQTPCVYLYTSGTTGNPKAVQHNADYPFFHWSTGYRWLQARPDDLIYNASDTGWGFTVWITVATWMTGAELLITPTNKKFDAKRMLSVLQDEQVTIFCAAPTVLRLLVADPYFDQVDLSKLRRVATVGEALDETVIQRFHKRGIEVAVGFGQAETPLIMGRVDQQAHVAGTMGRPITPYKVVILDDSYRPLPPGNVGQIAVDLHHSQAGIMRGYANAPEKTKQSRSPSGQYHLTGDWADYRRDGLFAYQGRYDDLIKSRGYRIGPDEVEKAGMSHPAIAKIAVIGIQEDVSSVATTVKALILLKPGVIESAKLIEDIQKHIKQETGPYKYPRLVEVLSAELWSQYETTSGKIRRAQLRQREHDRMQEAANISGVKAPH